MTSLRSPSFQRHRTRARLLALLALVSCATSSCRRETGWTRGLDPTEVSVLERWLFCDECADGERSAAAALGDPAVAPLGRVLERLPDDWTQNLSARYGVSATRSGLTGADSTAYVQRYLANFTATAQSRSAFSLSDIRTPEAIQLLRAAVADSSGRGYRSDVIRDIRRAEAAASSPPLAGDYNPKVARFLDTIWVTRGAEVPWDGDETVRLMGAPFADDVGVGFRAANLELGFVAAALPGEYAFSVANIGPGADAQHGVLRIGSFPAAPSLAPTTVDVGALPRTFLRSLTRRTTPADPAHFFRFVTGPDDQSLTARADWSGSSVVLDLVRDDCLSPGTTATTPRRISGRVLTATGNAVADASVTLVGTALAAGTSGTGAFEITNVPPGWIGTARASAIGQPAQNLTAWEGAQDLTFRLSAVATSFLSESPSPHSVSWTIPAAACGQLSLVRRDTTTAPAIVRLRVTSP